jgi:hypothetical protein
MCCPVEVALVRMQVRRTSGIQCVRSKLIARTHALATFQADSSAALADRRNYKHVFDAIFRIVKEEGIAACWTGVSATVARGMVVSMTQLATYVCRSCHSLP